MQDEMIWHSGRPFGCFQIQEEVTVEAGVDSVVAEAALEVAVASEVLEAEWEAAAAPVVPGKLIIKLRQHSFIQKEEE